jgi:prepilin-type N-terminal cleavage/methylation domain-containing protein
MKNKKGFTLMEVILSIAIFGIIAIFVVTIFSSGLKNIYRSGKRTEEVFELESKINEEILNEDNGDVLIKVDIPGVGEKEIEGKMITISSDDYYPLYPISEKTPSYSGICPYSRTNNSL